MFDAIPLNGQTWLVCGGRDFADAAMFASAMTDLIRMRGCPIAVVHGAARGADTMAGAWARRMGLREVAVPANWNAHGKAAGAKRNAAMLRLNPPPVFVVAFPGGRGTADMVAKARAAGIDVAEIVANAPLAGEE